MKKILTLSIAILLAPKMALATPSYAIQLVLDAGDPQHHKAYPTALTNGGLIGGSIWNNDSYEFDAFTWQNGQTTIIAQNPNGSSYITGINLSATVVGTTANSPGNWVTFAFFTQGDTTLFYPSATINPTGINNHGTIVGQTGSSEAHSATFDGQTITDLGTFGGISATGTAINNVGWVVSTATYWDGVPADAPTWRSFLTTPTGTIQLPSLGGTEDFAGAINDAGTVIGTSNGHAVKWFDNAITALDEVPGDDVSGAASINSDGIIVGWSGIAALTNLRATLWQDNTVFDLNTLISPDSGWILETANAINDSGQITGTGLYNGDSAIFLITPLSTPAVPEPAFLLSCLPTLFPLVHRRLRR